MSDFDRQLLGMRLSWCQTGPATPDKLVALAHAGLKAWAKVGNLQFPPERRYALLQEIMRYCAANACWRAASRRRTAWSGSRRCWTPPTLATPAPAHDSTRAATAMDAARF
ncbi:protein of unknown function (plasmid) [Cupriavidus taiwanensis]|nr:protein of unknown function [Cupriavidus taiwanensis]